MPGPLHDVLGLDVIVIHASTEPEIDAAFTSAVEQRTSAIFVDDAYFASRSEQIAAMGLRHRLPTFGVPQIVPAGMLIGTAPTFLIPIGRPGSMSDASSTVRNRVTFRSCSPRSFHL